MPNCKKPVSRAKRKKTILWGEDDVLLQRLMIEALEFEGFRILPAPTGGDVLKILESRKGRVDLVILDMMMRRGTRLRGHDTFGDMYTGLVVAKEIRSRYPRLPILGCSIINHDTVRTWFAEHGNGYLRKPVTHTALVEAIESAIHPKRRRRRLNTFIVHGHDHQLLYELKDFLQNVLGFNEPVVLRDQPSLGRTLIEKFEQESKSIDIAFVLMTPDDKVSPKRAPNKVKRRARQNVIFELGYFYAKLQRTIGRVIVLHKGSIELPSDIAGISYIDVSKGIAAAGEELRRELTECV